MVLVINQVQSIESPSYTVLNKINNKMEIRRYGPTKWVMTSMNRYTQADDKSSSSLFMRLFGYISGSNESKKKIPMTAPVMSTYSSTDGNPINSNSKFMMSMGFYVAGAESPKPTSDDVFLNNAQSMVVAVARFGGFAKFGDFVKNRDALVKALGAEAVNYDTVNFWTAGYDAPYKLFFRRNEVWLIQK
jgi:hypothetical protein